MTQRRDYRQLCVLQEKLDPELLRQTDFTYGPHNGCRGIDLTVFPQAAIELGDSPEATVASYAESKDFILQISADIILPRAYITLNTRYMSPRELIQKLRPVAAEHNKNLEVTL